jgi:hypothetical protein
MPWLRRLVASLSPWRPGFALFWSVYVDFVVDIVALEQVLLPSSLVLPCEYHSAMALHAHVICGGVGKKKACWWPQFRDIVPPHHHHHMCEW